MVPGRVAARYALILDAVSMRSAGLPLSRIAQATCLAKPTVHRLVRALVAIGYLTPGSGRSSYRIGPRLLRVLHRSIDAQSIAHVVQPALEALADRFGETAYVTKLVGVEARPIAVVVPKGLTQSIIQPTRVMPAHAAASAKAIVAFQEADVIRKILEEPLIQYTPNTLTTVSAVEEHLARVRARGYAECINEIDQGVMAIAVPIHLDAVGVLHSVAICGLLPRMKRHARRAVVDALCGAAQNIAGALQGTVAGANSAGHPDAEVDIRFAEGEV